MFEKEKKEVIRVALDAQRSGLCKHKSGNFSIIDRESGNIIITPSGIDREELQVDQVCVVDQELHCLEGLKPSSETLMHVECYKARPDIGGIAHTHSKMATVFACLNRPVPAMVFELFAYKLKDTQIPVAKFATPGTLELAKNTAEMVKESDLVLMEKHGAIAVGNTLADAYLAAQYLEEMAEMYYYALMINQGKEPSRFTQEDFDAWKYPSEVK